MHWHRRRRWFYFEGNLAGLRYEARLGILNLSALDTTEMQRMLDAPVADRASAYALQVWETDGGALVRFPNPPFDSPPSSDNDHD